MVAFEKMWGDVGELLRCAGALDNMHMLEGRSGVFAVDVDGDTEFITKEDFVDFWCRMLYYHQVSKEQILADERGKLRYVYEIVKTLPYVKEVSGVLTLEEE
jgi:hypothetical protein